MRQQKLEYQQLNDRTYASLKGGLISGMFQPGAGTCHSDSCSRLWNFSHPGSGSAAAACCRTPIDDAGQSFDYCSPTIG